MFAKCKHCGMIRSKKDTVLLEDGTHMCFSCWNQHFKAKEEDSEK